MSQKVLLVISNYETSAFVGTQQLNNLRAKLKDGNRFGTVTEPRSLCFFSMLLTEQTFRRWYKEQFLKEPQHEVADESKIPLQEMINTVGMKGWIVFVHEFS